MYSTGHIYKKEVDQPKPTVVVGSVDEILSKPKPTTGEHKAGCPAMGGYGHGVEPCICGADKPTTGEWTVERVAWFIQEYGVAWQVKIVEAINAALAKVKEAK